MKKIIPCVLLWLDRGIYVFLVLLAFLTFGFNKAFSPRPETLENLETEYSTKLPLKTNLLLTSSSTGYRLNDDVTFEAFVQPLVKIPQKPQGTVTFTLNGVKICNAVPLNSASFKATCTIHNKKVGIYSLVATYSGQKNFYSPSSASSEYSVIKLPSKTDLKIMPLKTINVQDEGWALTAKADKISANIPVTGRISFFVNTVPIPNCTNQNVQQATCQYIAKDTDGILEFSAQYSGDGNYINSSMQKTIHRKNGLHFEFLTKTFTYNPAISQHGFDFSVAISGNYQGKNILNLKDNLIFGIASMKSSENYLMEKEENTIDSQEFKDVHCTISFDNLKKAIVATCNSLRPIVSKFNLTAILKTKEGNIIASQTFPIVVHSDKISQIKISGNSMPSNGCGLQGTTRQRMFDCSLYVSNFAGRTNAQEQFAPYKFGNLSAEFDWFLVYCPKQSVPQSCSWLSPVLQAGNPALSSGESDSNGIAMSKYQGKRILWSGVSYQTSNFFQANGNDTNIFQYTEYPLENEGIMAKSLTKTRPVSSSMCKTGKGIPLLSTHAPYDWQMPSYPMIMTLTGGKYCDANGVGFEQDWQAFCNGGAMPQGSRAILVPSFVKTYLWSSSVDTKNNIAWIFNGTDGGTDVTILNDGCSVRCATFSW